MVDRVENTPFSPISIREMIRNMKKRGQICLPLNIIVHVFELKDNKVFSLKNPGGGAIFRTRPDRPWGPPSLLYNGYRVFPWGKAAGAWC
jgi:hypothetical protein